MSSSASGCDRRRDRRWSLCALVLLAATVGGCGEEDAEPALGVRVLAASLPKNGSGNPPMTYHGGFMQYHPKVHLIFWGPKWRDDPTHRSIKDHVEKTVRAFGAASEQVIGSTPSAASTFQPPRAQGLGLELDTPPATCAGHRPFFDCGEREDKAGGVRAELVKTTHTDLVFRKRLHVSLRRWFGTGFAPSLLDPRQRRLRCVNTVGGFQR